MTEKGSRGTATLGERVADQGERPTRGVEREKDEEIFER